MLGTSKVVAFAPTRDFGKAKAFFGDVLGLRLVSEDGFALVYDAAGTMLRVAKVGEMTPHPFTILGWEVVDIDGTVAALAGKGIVFERYPWMKQDDLGVWTAPGGAKVAWFKDPDGNLLSLSQHA